MAEVAPAPAAVPAKVPKKKSASKVKRQGLSVSEQIVNAVSGSKERNGVSLAALKKQLATGGYNVEKNNSRVKFAVRGLVSKGILIQATGTGASGSFKLNKKHTDAKKSVKKSTPKVKKSVTKKSTATKKVTAKKSDAKKSPRKAKKPAPKKVTKKSRKSVTPKKTMKTTKKVRPTKPKTVKSKAKKK